MSKISLLLHSVHDLVHTFNMNINFSEPKIYTGGVDISTWSSLSKPVQKEALLKKWYIYYSFRDSKTGKLKRQTNIKGEANRFKTKKDRYNYLKILQCNLLMLLERGFNPYADNSVLQEEFYMSTKKSKITPKPIVNIEKEIIKPKESDVATNELQASEALKFGLKIKKKTLNENSYKGYVSHINRFEKWLIENKLNEHQISLITKKNIIEYLNSVLQGSSARNRNNARASISSLFKTLEDNEIIKENFVRKINVLKTTPKRNKTYTPKQEKDILQYLKINDPILLLFIQCLSYNFLRPIEVCRLKIGDLDIEDKKLNVRAKNKAVKIKIIPDLLIEKLPDLSQFDKAQFLFTPEKIGGDWNVEDSNKRDHFSKRFKVVKDYFGLGLDYGLYSFRHTTITKLYRELRKEASPFEAKSKLMIITGHTTMLALEQYLRDIDAELPEDYSSLLKNK